eukprot:scaffold97041_cov38-Prasinocladus_malaysianus.AAC.2
MRFRNNQVYITLNNDINKMQLDDPWYELTWIAKRLHITFISNKTPQQSFAICETKEYYGAAKHGGKSSTERTNRLQNSAVSPLLADKVLILSHFIVSYKARLYLAFSQIAMAFAIMALQTMTPLRY